MFSSGPAPSDALYVGIVGSRRRATLHDREIVFKIVGKCYQLAHKRGKRLILVSGACRNSADEFAADAAKAFGIYEDMIEFPVDRTGLPPPPKGKQEFRKRAFARNLHIAREARDYLFALVHRSRTGGTENTIKHYQDYMEHEPWRRLFIIDDAGGCEQWNREIEIWGSYTL